MKRQRVEVNDPSPTENHNEDSWREPILCIRVQTDEEEVLESAAPHSFNRQEHVTYNDASLNTPESTRPWIILLTFLIPLAVLLVPVLLLVVPDASSGFAPLNNLNVSQSGIMEHAVSFQSIARQNNNIRSAGTRGYEASGDYVRTVLQNVGYNVTVQDFSFSKYRELGPSGLSSNGTAYKYEIDFMPLMYSAPGDVRALAHAVGYHGCRPQDFEALNVENMIAVIERGICTLETQGRNAERAGAVGAIIYNNVSGSELFTGSLSEFEVIGIPVFATSHQVGHEIMEGKMVHLFANTSLESIPTFNVLAESINFTGSQIVMAGAHLDSVPAGPGMNDNASGSSALVEIALKLTQLNNTVNKICFAWWGAEEAGLKGSKYFVNTLASEELQNFVLYVNLDMIASPNFIRGIYAGDSFEEEKLTEDMLRYFQYNGIPAEAFSMGCLSDHCPFSNVGIPVVGLFTGSSGTNKTVVQVLRYGGKAGAVFDPCYHHLCDTIDNLNMTVLVEMTQAAAYILQRHANKK